MEDKEFFEESVISNLENFNVFDLSFIEAFRFFYSNYDFELPEDYKAKLLTVLSDYDKVEKDYDVKIKELEGLELKKISNYLTELKSFSYAFSLMNVFNISERRFKVYRKIFNDNSNSKDRNKDYDSVLNYNKKVKELLNHFSTKVSVKIENPFLERLKKANDERTSKFEDITINLEESVISLDVEEISVELYELINSYDE